MPLIKRYPNRKLYDTAAKQYVSLDDLARMIRQGESVQVTDHATGEDVTHLVLVQIIVEQEKNQGGFLPLAVLTGLVQAGGNTLATLRRSLTAPLDLLHHVDEEIQRRVERLVSLGELAEDEGRRLVQRLLAQGSDRPAEPLLDDAALTQQLQTRRLPTRADLQALSDRLDQLMAEVEALRRP